MNTWVLIIITSISSMGGSITIMQTEFTSEAKCEIAAKSILKQAKSVIESIGCYEK